MKNIQKIELHLENMEYISLKASEIEAFEMNGVTEAVAKIGDCFVQFSTFANMKMRLAPMTNRTYGSFGRPSQKSIFERLCENPTLGCVKVIYDDASSRDFFVRDTFCYVTEVTDDGHLEYAACDECDCPNSDMYFPEDDCEGDCDCCGGQCAGKSGEEE